MAGPVGVDDVSGRNPVAGTAHEVSEASFA
jgi:hypothetical protein